MKKTYFSSINDYSLFDDSEDELNIDDLDDEECSELLESNIPMKERLLIINRRVKNVLGKQQRNIIVIKDKFTFITYMDQAIASGRIAIDTETYNTLDPVTGKIVGLCLYYPGGKQAYVPINHRNPYTKERLIWQLTEKDINEQLQRISDLRKDWKPDFDGQTYCAWWVSHVYLKGEKCKSPLVIMHNGKFDYEVIFCTSNIRVPVDWDTMVAARLLNENDKAGLKYLYTKFVDKSQSKYDIEGLFTNVLYTDVDPDIFSLYAATDALMTDKLFELQIDYLSKPEQARLFWLFYFIEMPILTITAEQELIGIKVDLDYIGRLKEKYTNKLNNIDAAIAEEMKNYQQKILDWKLSPEANKKTKVYVSKKSSLSLEKIKEKYPFIDEKGKRYKYTKPAVEKIGDTIDFGSSNQVAIFLYDILNCPVVDKENPRGTGEEVLEELNNQLHLKIFDLLLERRGVIKLLTSYINNIPVLAKHWPDGRVRFHLNQLGTDTGRFSSGGKIAYCENDERFEINGINIQNIPSKYSNIRLIFVGETSKNIYPINGDTFTINEYEEIEVLNGWKYPRDFEKTDQLIDVNGEVIEVIGKGYDSDTKTFTFKFNSNVNTKINSRIRRRIVGSDYSAQEPRLTCFISQDENMLNAYKEGKDLYAVISSAALNNDYSENLEFWPEGTELEIDGQKVICGYKTHKNLQGKANRNLGKLLLLASTYGMSGATAGANMGKSAEEGQQLLDNFFARFKKVKGAIDYSEEFLDKYGYVEDWAGRRRHLEEYFKEPYEISYISKLKTLQETFNPLLNCKNRSAVSPKMSQYLQLAKKCRGNKEFEKLQLAAEKDGYTLISNTGKIAQAKRQCFNARIQGGAATLTKLAMINIYNDPLLKEYQARLICSVHDEILVECLDYYNKEVEKRLPQIMIDAAKPYMNVPMKCDPYNVTRWYSDEIANHLLDDYKSLEKKNLTHEDIMKKLYEENTEIPKNAIDRVINGEVNEVIF